MQSKRERRGLARNPAFLVRRRGTAISRRAVGGFICLFVLLAFCGSGFPAAQPSSASGRSWPGSAGFPRLARQPLPLDLSWYYLRSGQALQPDEPAVELLFVGDVMLGRGAAGRQDAFAAVAEKLAAADLALANLEGALAAPVSTPVAGIDPAVPSGGYRLVMPAGSAALLQGAGLDVLSQANNHALDAGPQALESTARRLESAGIRSVGAGPLGEPGPLVVRVNGLRIAILAWNAVGGGELAGGAARGWQPAKWDQTQAQAAVRAARAQADVVVVLIHWGREYDSGREVFQKDAAQKLVKAGAVLVVGSHPHTIQKGQVVAAAGPDGRDAYVAYSLGNFVFDSSDERAQHGLGLRVYLDRGGLRAVQGLAVVAGPRPHWLNGAEAAPWLEQGRPESQRLVYQCDLQGCTLVDGVLCSIAPPTYWLSDLTGDGEPERILLHDGRVRIYSQTSDQPAWESPPEWDVVSMDAGDPNDDGRLEIILALNKVDADGVRHSHPFIIGYRGGTYRDVWGGSAVAYPIQELALADMDGDGVQELLVLEQRSDGEQAPAVWKWNGWGYTLAWRGDPGRYRNMRACADELGRYLLSIEKLW